MQEEDLKKYTMWLLTVQPLAHVITERKSKTLCFPNNTATGFFLKFAYFIVTVDSKIFILFIFYFFRLRAGGNESMLICHR